MEQDRDQYFIAGVLMVGVAILEWAIPAQMLSPLSWAVSAGVFFILAILKTVQINRKNKMTRQP